MKQRETKLNKRKSNLLQITAFLSLLLFFASTISAQVSTIKLSTDNNTSYFDVTNSSDASKLKIQADGRVGINQTTPTAGLHMVSIDGLLLQGTHGSGNTWSLGAGTRMHWISKWGAFRAGRVTDTEWDNTNVGINSFATGYNTTASGDMSTALGYRSVASADNSTAMGRNTTASGLYSTAMGYYSEASGDHSNAAGRTAIASGFASTARGYITTASGNYSTAMGSYVSTNSLDGSFIIGDRSSGTTTHTSSLANQMTMRFANGYMLYTNSGASAGVQVAAGGSSWSTISDSTKKENFLYADGEKFLNNISTLRLGSWNYIGQNPENFRHYGPMAQEIYSHFGNDGIGTIGCDTLLATADMDGIMMIAIQALEKRTDELKIINIELEQKLVSQNELLSKLLTEFTNMKNGDSPQMASFITSTSRQARSTEDSVTKEAKF